MMAIALRACSISVSGCAGTPANPRAQRVPQKFAPARKFDAKRLRAQVPKPPNKERFILRSRAEGGDTDQRLLATRFLSTIGLPPDEVSRITQVEPEIFNADIDRQLARAIDVLFDAGVDPDDLPLLVSRCPRILVMDVDKELEPMSRFLQQQLRLQKEQMRKILTRFPEVFLLSIEQQVAPAVKFIKEFGGATDDDIPNIIYACPQALSFSIPRLGTSMHWLVPKRPE